MSCAVRNQQPIRAVLIDTNCCKAAGITVRAGAPVLALCRKLVAAGHDPALPLHVFWGDSLAFRVRSIGEAASLTISGDGIGFRRKSGLVGASYSRLSKRSATPPVQRPERRSVASGPSPNQIQPKAPS